MTDRYFKRGRQINVSMKDLLGSGGQANVVMVDGMAVKLWKTPDRTQIRKVEYYLKNPPKLPNNFLFPADAITNESGAMVGYEMRPLPSNFREGGVLFNKTLRLTRNITTPTLLAVIDSARGDLESLHNEKIVCGDVSGRNFAFVISGSGIKTFWYDTDAYQVAGYPCPVWTEFFLCPSLYKYATGANGSAVPFSEESDNYSFATILFWSLFNTNPYMQTHLKYPDFKDKAANGIWLLDSGVKYPKNLCPPPEVVSDKLLGYFEQVFKKHQYLPLQHEDLMDYSKSVIECPSCQTFYPNMRASCPKCTTKTAGVDFVPLYKYERLLETNGQIMFAKYQHGNLYVVSKEKKGYFVHIRPGKGQVVSGLIPLDQTQASDYRFDIVGDSHLLVNATDGEGIFLTPIDDLGTWITTSTATYQGNRQATFRGTAKGLYRLAGDQLMLGEVKNGYLVDKAQPAMFNAGQTWFWSDAAGDRLVSMSRFFSRYQYQLLNSRGRLEMEPALLEETDSILEMSVMFGDDNVCMRRIVNRKGRSVILTDVFDSFGKNLLSTTHFVSRLPGQDIQQVTYNRFKVYWPTDTGIVVEDLNNNSLTTLGNTEKIADSDCRLIYLGGGSNFLVVREHKVNYLVL